MLATFRKHSTTHPSTTVINTHIKNAQQQHIHEQCWKHPKRQHIHEQCWSRQKKSGRKIGVMQCQKLLSTPQTRTMLATLKTDKEDILSRTYLNVVESRSSWFGAEYWVGKKLWATKNRQLSSLIMLSTMLSTTLDRWKWTLTKALLEALND